MIDEEQSRQRDAPWEGEAWCREDGLVLNLPIFKGCSLEFKRLLLRAIRECEYIEMGKETWYDADFDEICTLDKLPQDRLAPLQPNFIGRRIAAGEYVCKGGDYDNKLVLVCSGTVDKLVGDAPQGGLCVVRTLQRGDCEGITEFLNVGSEQRTCALRGGPNGAHVRYVTRAAVTNLLAQQVVDQSIPFKDEEDKVMKSRWPAEVAYFAELSLDRIDSLNHKASLELLKWDPGPIGTVDTQWDFLHIKGQTIFVVDNALGTSVSGPLPEGIEERYFFNGQTVIQPGQLGDCCIFILRGQVEGVVPDGCGGHCLNRRYLPEGNQIGWIGHGRDCGTGYIPSELPSDIDFERSNSQDTADEADDTGPRGSVQKKETREVAMVTLVAPANYRRARAHLTKASEDKIIDLSGQKSTDWRWSWDDRNCLGVFDVLQKARLLTERGLQLADQVRLHLNPPPEPPPPAPQATLGTGTKIGRLAIMGVPIVLSGPVRAKGPVLVAILHRHVLLKAIENCPEAEIFKPKGLTLEQRVKFLLAESEKKYALGLPTDTAGLQDEHPSHLGPATGPPARSEATEVIPLAGSVSAWTSKNGPYGGIPSADAFEHVLLNSIMKFHLLWDVVHDAPPRLLADLIRAWEPRWLLPGEVIILDEEPDADFIFILIYGVCNVTVAGRQIAHLSQGDVNGGAQLLSINTWTRSVRIDTASNGEAMIQIFRRSDLVSMLEGHPLPKIRFRQLDNSLSGGKEADWRLLKNLPAFGSASFPPFLSKIYQDGDILLFCAGEVVARSADPAAAMMIVLAGAIRLESAQTLFVVELSRGEWCFQDNILGNITGFGYDVVAVTNVMVMVLYRHALQHAISVFPETTQAIMRNETWRKDASLPQINCIKAFEKLPANILKQLLDESSPAYYKEGSVVLEAGQIFEDGSLLFILRGEMKVSVLGIEVRTLKPGSCVGILGFMGLDYKAGQTIITSSSACDCIRIQKKTMDRLIADELLEDDLLTYTGAMNVLDGGEILDAFGFPIGDGSAKNCPDTLEKSEVFAACSDTFVAQLPSLVEDVAFWPGERIYSQYDIGEKMYFIRAGRLRVEILGRKNPEILDAGGTIGDLAVLDQVPSYSETVSAETHVWVRVLHKKLLYRSLSSFPEEEKKILSSDRLSKRDARNRED